MCRMYIIIIVAILRYERWNKLVDEWAGRENGLTRTSQGTLLSRKTLQIHWGDSGIVPRAYEYLSPSRTFSERIFGKKKNRDFYLILTRSFHLYIMAYKEIPVSGYWRVTRFRHLRQRRRRHKCYKRINVIMLLETIWQSISRSRDEKSSFVPFIFSNIVTRFRCGRFRITTVFTTRSYIMKIRLKSGRRSQHKYKGNIRLKVVFRKLWTVFIFQCLL